MGRALGSGAHHTRKACIGTPGFQEALLEARLTHALEQQQMLRQPLANLCSQPLPAFSSPPAFSSQLEFSAESGSTQLELSSGLPTSTCALTDWVGATVHIGIGSDAEHCQIASVDASGHRICVTHELQRDHTGRLGAHEQPRQPKSATDARASSAAAAAIQSSPCTLPCASVVRGGFDISDTAESTSRRRLIQGSCDLGVTSVRIPRGDASAERQSAVRHSPSRDCLSRPPSCTGTPPLLRKLQEELDRQQQRLAAEARACEIKALQTRVSRKLQIGSSLRYDLCAAIERLSASPLGDKTIECTSDTPEDHMDEPSSYSPRSDSDVISRAAATGGSASISREREAEDFAIDSAELELAQRHKAMVVQLMQVQQRRSAMMKERLGT